MNETSTNAGSWRDSYMRMTSLPALLSRLPNDLQAVIKPVRKRTFVVEDSSLVTTTDGLFLLSEDEVFEEVQYGESGEGTQYEYYAAGNTTVKKKAGAPATATAWWLRSPYINSNRSFCLVGSAGRQSNDNAAVEHGVAIAFCI